MGDPFIKQILQAAKHAGKDLGVNVKTTGTPAFDPAAQLKMLQDLFASGADGVATSITGDSTATGLNALVAQGHAQRPLAGLRRLWILSCHAAHAWATPW